MTRLNHNHPIALLLLLALLVVSCAPAVSEEPAAATPPAAETPAVTPPDPEPGETATERTQAAPTATAALQPAPTFLPEEDAPPGLTRSFTTDFSKRTISFDDILSGGPPKDGIPAVDNPVFISVSEAEEWIEDLEPVLVFQESDETRIYPYQILTWHEIVNDEIGGRPLAITFCPLCNTAIVFDATVDGTALDFGTTGRLRFSNLLMYDRQSESWWQQATGEAVIGEYTGVRLTILPASIISWVEARAAYPEAQVLSRQTGHDRPYGRNPYAGYDNVNASPFLYEGPLSPDQLPPMTRVTTVELNGEAVAYPEETLQEIGVANDTVGGLDIVIFWQEGLASALDASDIAAGRDVGATAVFERELDGQTLTFTVAGGEIVDEQTGSAWTILGEAVSGELAGEQLEPVAKVDHFWFSWAAFRPDTRIYQP